MLTTVLAAAEGAENSVIIPHDIDEVIWSSIAFFLVVALLYKLGKDPISKAIKDKRGSIEAEFDSAAQERSATEAELATVRSQLSGADDERARILDDARRTATGLATEYRERTSREVEESRARALRDIESNKTQAMADLQGMIGDLTLGAAELVVRNNLDDDTQRQLVDRYITELSVN